MNKEVCNLVNLICGQPKLIVRGYLLVKDKSINRRYYWCCEFKDVFNCKRRAITDLENEEYVLKKFNDHNHTSNASCTEVIQTLNNIKEVASNRLNQPVQIIQHAMTNMSQESSHFIPNTGAIHINISDYLRKTISGNQFLAKEIELEDEKMLIFCINSNLKHLYKASYWLMDSIFKIVPLLFYQLYLIHASVGKDENSHIFLMVYVLMTSRSEEIYKRLFEEIVVLGEQASYDLLPNVIITDFEQTNLWRKIQAKELATEYGNNQNFSINLHYIMILAFLSPEEILAAFDQVKHIIPENSAKICSIDDLVELDYPRTQILLKNSIIDGVT
ncbi:17136_t:CDS:2 [Funneliformis caledonium]|uniref:17136_t:CDS:1 n=1 Tax=Funneliformis caledonium TaxID=1117310 RepID=A0A9N8ZCS2_9GLOM|nr:17136_t:CDS:2 [Funneliformis caledonium]